MGSYMMVCAVSGATIPEGSDVVAFEMAQEKHAGRGNSGLFNREWFIKDFPFHGIYNDYGTVLLPDGSSVSSSETELMIMHKWAWQTLVDMVEKGNVEEDQIYVEYKAQGYDYVNYRLKHIDDCKKAIDHHISKKSQGIPTLETLNALLATATESEKTKLLALALESIRNTSFSTNLAWFGEGCSSSDSHWREKILDSEDPHATYERFLNEVLNIMHSTRYVFFRLYPSMYGSQEPNGEHMIEFFKNGIRYFESQR